MRLVPALLVSLGVLALDQGTKWYIETVVMDPPRAIPVTSFFDLVLVYNRGVSFGMLSSQGRYAPYILTMLALVIVSILAFWLWRADSAPQRVALAIIIGGALSNVIDRLGDGAVTDFLDFYAGAYHWPAFNLADVAITCGAGLLLLESLWPRGRRVGQAPVGSANRR